MSKWEAIPSDTHILVTHCPPSGILDTSGYPHNKPRLGCSLLRERVDLIKPKIHVFGHIHGSAGYLFHNGTHFFNASILNEEYQYTNKPITFDWDKETNTIDFI
jgi:Icc-related predicted phosphoesterase